MDEERAPQPRQPRVQRPSEVQITIVPARKRSLRARNPAARLQLVRSAWRAASSAPKIGALAFVAAALAAIIAVGVEGEGVGGSTRANEAQVQHASAAAVAAAYGYPLRCLSIAISASDPTYARAHLRLTTGCARHRAYDNASFHRINGRWRLVLDEGQLFVPNYQLADATHRLTTSRRGPRLQ